MHSSIFQIFALLLIVGCTSKSKTTQESSNTTPSHSAIPSESQEKNIPWDKYYDIAEQETIAYYNQKEESINSKEEQLSAVQFVGLLLEEPEEGVVRTVLDADSNLLRLESGAQVVIVQEEKIPDDSIFGEIRFFKVRNQNSRWDILAVSSVWSCYSGRGHQDYSTLPCH